MKQKVWCVSSDGEIVGYFCEYEEAIAYIANAVDPDYVVGLKLVSIIVEE